MDKFTFSLYNAKSVYVEKFSSVHNSEEKYEWVVIVNDARNIFEQIKYISY